MVESGWAASCRPLQEHNPTASNSRIGWIVVDAIFFQVAGSLAHLCAQAKTSKAETAGRGLRLENQAGDQ
jgi:hypothetical protein